jgi:5-(carboxyamino)imidazole ribonucleotide mutase
MNESTKPLVGVIMGSLSDYPKLKGALDLFENWGVPYEVIVASAHRTPERVAEWAGTAESRGLEVIIAAAGGAAHLPGVVAANTILPIVGLPIEFGSLQGVDALYSIVQMPPGIPVATVGINGAANAAVLALHILARIDAHWREMLTAYRAGMGDKIDKQNEELRAERPGAVWGPVARRGKRSVKSRPSGGVSEEDETEPAAEFKAPSRATGPAATAVSSRRVRIESDLLPVEIVETAVDCLLEGGVIALPTDTVYGLAVDATNDAAVKRLFEIKQRDPDRSIAIFIESTRALGSIVRELTPDVRRLLEGFWPGPLTVVFERRGEDFAHLAQGRSIGVRMPDHVIPLTIMQELRRPIACTSANLAGEPPAIDADRIERQFGGALRMILDIGPLERRPVSTVLDVSGAPYRILREGAIGRDRLSALVGDLLEGEEEG